MIMQSRRLHHSLQTLASIVYGHTGEPSCLSNSQVQILEPKTRTVADDLGTASKATVQVSLMCLTSTSGLLLSERKSDSRVVYMQERNLVDVVDFHTTKQAKKVKGGNMAAPKVLMTRGARSCQGLGSTTTTLHTSGSLIYEEPQDHRRQESICFK